MMNEYLKLFEDHFVHSQLGRLFPSLPDSQGSSDKIHLALSYGEARQLVEALQEAPRILDGDDIDFIRDFIDMLKTQLQKFELENRVEKRIYETLNEEGEVTDATEEVATDETGGWEITW